MSPGASAGQRVVVIGAGAAGLNAAIGLRNGGFSGEIVLISSENRLPYRRPAVSKELLRGEREPSEVLAKQPQWYEEQAIELQLDTEITAIDRSEHAIKAADGRTWRYDTLILATGAEPISLGARSPRVRTVRTADDVAGLAEILSGDVVIVGAGLIGGEVASAVSKAGGNAVVLEGAEHALARVLPPAAQKFYESLHRDNGVELHTGVSVSDISDDGDAVTVSASDGRNWRADCAIVAIGAAPRTQLAADAGLEVENGIVVDEHGRTSDPAIFAAGDVASRPEPIFGGRQRTEHWQSAMAHGSAVGRTVAGGDEALAEVPLAWTEQHGTNLQVVGWPTRGETFVERGSLSANDGVLIAIAGGRVAGAVAVARPAELRAARELIESGVGVDPVRLADPEVEVADAGRG